MNEYDEYDEYDEAYDEYDESDEAYDEAAPNRRRRPGLPVLPRRVPTARPGSAFQAPPRQGGVTQAQLQAALAKVNAQISTNSKAIHTLDGRLRGVATEQDRQGSEMRKALAAQKKENALLHKKIQDSSEMSAILPLLGIDPIMGLLLTSGGGLMGGTSSSEGGNSGGMMNSPLLLVAALSGGLGKKSP
jgi:hypothetical protein